MERKSDRANMRGKIWLEREKEIERENSLTLSQGRERASTSTAGAETSLL